MDQQNNPEGQAEETAPNRESMGSQAANSLSGRGAFRVADRLSGGKASEKAAQIGQKFDQTKAGQAVNNVRGKVANVRDKVDDIKNRAANKVTKPFKDAGKKAIGQAAQKGAQLAAKAGLTAAAGATTGGIATLVQAGAGVAKKVSAVNQKFSKFVDKATLGLVNPDIFGGIKRRLKYSWRKNKWKIIAGSCLLLAIMLIAPFIITMVLISRFFFWDTSDKAEKATINSITSLESSGALVFSNTGDLAAIKDGKIGRSSLRLINYLAKNHERIEISYNPKPEDATAATIGNEQYEFDIVSADKIKCTKAAGEKAGEIPVNLSSKYDFVAAAKTIPVGAICASGYYPFIDAKKEGVYATTFGPGEFNVSEIATKGKMAAQEKLAETVDDILDANAKSGIDKTSDDSIFPASVKIDNLYAKTNIRTGGAGILSAMKSKINHYYTTGSTEAEGVTAQKNNKFGLHVSFL